MDKILRSTSVSGSRRLTDNDQPAINRKATSHAEAAKPRSEVASQPASIPPNTDNVSIDHSILENLKSEKNRLQAELDKKNLELQERTRELNTYKEADKSSAHQEGFNAGKEQALSQWSEQLNIFATLVKSIEQGANKSIEGLEPIAAEVAFASVCRILGEGLATKEYVISTVKTVIDEVNQDIPVNVHVSPNQYQLIEEHKDDIAKHCTLKSVSIVADSRVEMGGCMVETAVGNWDGRLEKQLERLKRSLSDTLKGNE